MNVVRKLLSIFKSPALRAVTRWSKGSRCGIAASCALTAISTVLGLGLTIVTRGLIDSATGHNTDGVGYYAVILVAVSLGSRLISVLSAQLKIRVSTGFQCSLQKKVTDSLLRGDYASLKPYHSGELVNRVFSDVSIVKDGVTGIPVSVTGMLISFLGSAAILISMDGRFMILMLAGGVLGLLFTALLRSPMKKRHKRAREAEGKLHASTQETLENLRLIKAGMSEQRASARMDAERNSLAKEQIRRGRFTILLNSGMGFLFEISWLVCMIWGCMNISKGMMTYGSLAAMIQLIGRIQGPIASASGIAGQAYGMIASAERLKELTDVPAEPDGEQLRDFEYVSFENVSFGYADGSGDVLSSLNCAIKSGDTVALTGISGEGKTTFLQLILGIYAPCSGRVLFASSGKTQTASRSTRALFAYVPQGNMLFSGTLRENLAFFTDGVSDDEIMAAAKAACIDGLVKEIGLDAVLGERGIGLSEGQGQRVAVARALLSRAPILLLDESTSALDEATEAEMLKNIARMQGKTVIIVTHRRKALDICNRVLRLEGGSIAAV